MTTFNVLEFLKKKSCAGWSVHLSANEGVSLCTCGTYVPFKTGWGIPSTMCPTCGSCVSANSHQTRLNQYNESADEAAPSLLEAVKLHVSDDDLVFTFYQSEMLFLERALLEQDASLLTAEIPAIGTLSIKPCGTIEATGQVQLDDQTLAVKIGCMDYHPFSRLDKQTLKAYEAEASPCEWKEFKSDGWTATTQLNGKLTFIGDIYYSPARSRSSSPLVHWYSILINSIPQVDEALKANPLGQLIYHTLNRRNGYNGVREKGIPYHAVRAIIGGRELIRRYPQMEQVYAGGFKSITQEWAYNIGAAPHKKFKLDIYFKKETSLSKIMTVPSFVRQDLAARNVEFAVYRNILKIHEISPIGDVPYQIFKKISHMIDLSRFYRCVREGAGSFNDILTYINRCYINQGIPVSDALVLWDDYLTMARRANLPHKPFPSLLKLEHDLMVRDASQIKNEATIAAFEKRAEDLSDLTFEDPSSGYGIYVPKTPDDLIKEGRTLRHCVGAYDFRFASGETTVLFLRKLSDKSTPLYTVEWCESRNEVLQLRGKANAAVHNKEAVQCLNSFLRCQKEKRVG